MRITTEINVNYKSFIDIELKPRIRLFILDLIKQFAEIDQANPKQVIRLCKEYLNYIDHNHIKEFSDNDLIPIEAYNYNEEN